MLKEKKLYSVLLVLLAFSLIGEQPNLKGDLKRASDHVLRTLQVNEVMAGWQSFVNNAGNVYRGFSNRWRASADVVETANKNEIDTTNGDKHYKKVMENLENKTAERPLQSDKGRCS